MIKAGASRFFRRAWRGTQVGLALVAIGCSGGTSGEGGATFCQDYVNAEVTKLTGCQGGSAAAYDTLFQTINLCNGVSADLAAGKITFSPQAAQACLAEVASSGCANFGASLPDCAKVYTGVVPAGASCLPIPFAIAGECAPGSRCVADTQCPGTCQPYATLGMTCGTSEIDQCAPPLICTSTGGPSLICATAPSSPAVGSPCSDSVDCESSGLGLVCEGPNGPLDDVAPSGTTGGGACLELPATGPCWSNSDCSTNNCAGTNSGTTLGACMPGKVVGDACVPGQNQCGPGTYCGTANKCVELPSVGHSCAGNAGEGTQCINGFCGPLTATCVPFLAAGETCEGQGGPSNGSCDGFNTQCSDFGVCLPTCAAGSACGGSGQICCAGDLCGAGFVCRLATCVAGSPETPDAGMGGGHDAQISTGVAIVPNASGYFDGSNAAGVIGAWWSSGDDYSPSGVAGTGNCPMAGFPNADCSTIVTPIPWTPFTPDPNGRGMCTSGIAAQVLAGDGGAPDYSAIWGNIIGFDLDDPGQASVNGGIDASRSDAGSKGQYSAPAHGVTGVAFDIDTPPVSGSFRVEFQTLGTENNAAYWGGASSNSSPVFSGGHYEIRWPDVAGPMYLTNPPPFDPTNLEAVVFHVLTNPTGAVPYSFCINNIVMLTN